jgi:hypothetical protein
MRKRYSEMAAKQASEKAPSPGVFGQRRKHPKMFRVGLYARVSTFDQHTIPLQIRTLREYAARRGWTIAMHVKEVGSGAAQRLLREKLLDAARRREIDVVLVWRLDRWGRSVADLLATRQELDHRFCIADRSTRSDHARRAGHDRITGSLRRVRTRDSARACPCGTGRSPAERNSPGPTRNRCLQSRRGSETASRRHQQIRDRTPPGYRPHLGAPHSGLTYSREKHLDPERCTLV